MNTITETATVPAPVESAPTPALTFTEALAKIESLTRSVQELEVQLEAKTVENRALRTDGERTVEVISECLIEKANQKGWCNEYDQFIEYVNGKLPRWTLMSREQDYVAYFDVTVEVTVSVAVPVSANDADAATDLAEGMVRDYLTDYEVGEALRYNGYEITDETHSYTEEA